MNPALGAHWFGGPLAPATPRRSMSDRRVLILFQLFPRSGTLRANSRERRCMSQGKWKARSRRLSRSRSGRALSI